MTGSLLTCILVCLCCRWSTQHCEIAGWGMQEYNNTNSYPDSVRAAKITVVFSHPVQRIVVNMFLLCQVNTVSAGVCDYLYGRDVDSTGKFCAGGAVDACQVRGLESGLW